MTAMTDAGIPMGEGRIVRDEAVRALQIIRDETDGLNPVSWRSDDREGCLDGVHSEAQRALDYIAKVEAADTPPPAAAGDRSPFDLSTLLNRERALHCFACGGAIGTTTCNCSTYSLSRAALASALEWARRDAVRTPEPNSGGATEAPR